MNILRIVLVGLAGTLCICGATGCESSKRLLHEIQPHRLQRWNRGNGMESGFEAYYSIRDEIPGDRPSHEPVSESNELSE